MIDIYTKIVLTVIAAALTAIAAGQWHSPAQAQRGLNCTDMLPCIVEVRKSVIVGNAITLAHPVEIFGKVETWSRP